MRNCIMIALGLVMSASLFGQLKPEPGDKAFMFNINGLADLSLSSFENSILYDLTLPSPGNIPYDAYHELLPGDMLFFRYYIEEDKVVRGALGVGYIDRSYMRSQIDGYSMAIDVNFWAVNVGIGYEQHYVSNARRIDPYGGLQLNAGYFSGLQGRDEEMRTQAGSDITEVNEYTLPAGFRVQLQVLGGVNFFVSDNLSIGGEFSFGPMYTSAKGDWQYTRTTTVTPATGNGQTTVENFTGTSGVEALQLTMGGATGFNVAFYF